MPSGTPTPIPIFADRESPDGVRDDNGVGDVVLDAAGNSTAVALVVPI